MDPNPDNSNEHHLQSENRFLQETILSLRQKLETLDYEKDQSIVDAVSSASDEIKQLKDLIEKMG